MLFLLLNTHLSNNRFLVLKKMKHRMVEHLHSSTADSLGLSRAILVNGE